MFRLTVLILILPYLLKLDAISTASKRLSLIYHEPPVEGNLRGADRVSEHFITQRLDNFDHQNPHTFQMVLQAQTRFKIERNFIDSFNFLAAVFEK